MMFERWKRWFTSMVNGPSAEMKAEKPWLTGDFANDRQQMLELGRGKLDFVERLIAGRSQDSKSGMKTEMKAALYFYQGVCDLKWLQHTLVPRLQAVLPTSLELLQASWLPMVTVEKSADRKIIERKLTAGYAIVLLADEAEALLIAVPRELARSLEEPVNEFVTRGPRLGMTEDLPTNLGLIRKYLKAVTVRADGYQLGTKTGTACALIYIEEIALPEIVKRAADKLSAVRTDAVFDTGQVEELIEDASFSPFDEFMNTERPDKVAAELLEGRVAILIDGSPTAIIGPVTFFNLLSSPDDHYQRFIAASFHRLLRFGGFAISAHLSALYLAMVSYHSHLIPMKLVEILMSKREQVPFPPLFEIVMMQIMIDMVLEAILRLPTKLGQIIGVSGAIVIGQAAISANLISPGVLIVVSITTITGFAMPRLSTAYTVQVLRYANLLLASVLGGFGLMVSVMFWLIHLCHLQSLGKAYLSPLSPFKWHDMRDMLFRLPKWLMVRQPDQPGAKEPSK